MKVSELIVTLNEFLEPCSSDFRVGNYFHSIPIGRVHVRGDRGSDTGDEDTEDEDTSAALFQAKRQERDLEQSFDSNPDSDGVDDWLEQRVRRARLLWQARLLMCESRNNITSMHAQSDEEVTEVTTPLTRKTGVTAPLNYVYVLENTKICTISRGGGIKQKV
jgi:hypothetical protein